MLSPAAAGNTRQALQFLLHAAFETVEIDIGLAQYGRGQARFLIEQGGEKVLDLDMLLPAASGQPLSILQRSLSFFGESVNIHPHLLREIRSSCRRRASLVPGCGDVMRPQARMLMSKATMVPIISLRRSLP